MQLIIIIIIIIKVFLFQLVPTAGGSLPSGLKIYYYQNKK